MKTIIIGGGAAGISALDTLIRDEKITKVVLIHNEKIKPYYRPFISKCFIKETDKIDNFFLKSNDWYQKTNKVDFKNDEIKSVDFENKIITGINENYSYDKLIIATGSHAFNLPNIDIKQDGVFNLINISDVNKIRAYFQKNKIKNAVVIGGGILGCEAAYSLINLNIKVDLIELQEYLLPRLLTQESSKILQKIIENHNVNINLKTSVSKINKIDKKFEVILENNKKIKTDIIVVAIGVRPNINFLDKTKIKIERGIIVNEKMETSVKNVYACGDIIEIKPHITKMIWFPALETGRIAANNILQKIDNFNVNKKYPVLYSSFNITLIMVGDKSKISPSTKILKTINDLKNNSLSFLAYENDKVIWAISLNDQSAGQIISQLVFKKEEEIINEYKKYNESK